MQNYRHGPPSPQLVRLPNQVHMPLHTKSPQQAVSPKTQGVVRLLPSPWYHGPITRQEAERLLQPREDGLFLIRESVNYRGDFTLCLCIGDTVEHYRIIYNPDTLKYTIDEESYFATLQELVEHYTLDADGLVCRLSRPLLKKGVPCYPPVLDLFRREGWLLASEALVIHEKLGAGTFAEVYRASYKDAQVAAKCIPLNGENSFLGLNEAAVMTALNHPNVIRFLGLVTFEGKMYFISEFMQQGALVNYLRTRGKFAITPAHLLSFAVDACAGLAHLTERGFVHRDVAARNVLLNHTLQAKLSDFGLCIEAKTNDPKVVGKVPVKWTAPEAVRHSIFSPASDVWSFGVLLWEIYSYGKLPYLGVSVTEVQEEVESGLRLPPPQDCPQEMYSVMEACWKLNPGERATIHQLLLRLKRLRGT